MNPHPPPARRLALVSWVMICGGCASATVDLTNVQQAAGPTAPPYNDLPWATVLRENVHDGLVDYDHLAAHRQPLDEFLAMLATGGPDSTPSPFPTPESRLCYYVNAYNAAALAAVLQAGIPPQMHGFPLPAFDQRYGITLDRRRRTLGEIRRLAIAGDVRAAFCLCDAALGSPPLWEQPFRPEGLEDTLRRVSQAAMDCPNIVRVNHERQWLMLSPLFVTWREEFLQYYRSRTGGREATLLNVVLHFAGTTRRQWLNTAVGYAEHIIPFDSALNRWPPPDGA